MFWRRKPKSRNLQEEKRKAKVHNAKVSLAATIIMLLGLIYLLVMGHAFEEIGTRGYYKTHQAIFLVCALISLGFIVTESFVPHNLGVNTRKALQDWRSVSVPEWENLVWGLSFVLAAIGFLTVDLSFFQHYGMRISTVVGMAFFRILRVAFMKRS